MGHFGALATCSPFDTLTNGQRESFTVLGYAYQWNAHTHIGFHDFWNAELINPAGSAHHIAYAEVLERFTWPLWTSQQSSVWKGAHLAVTAPTLSGGCKMDLGRLRLADMQSATGKEVWQWIVDSKSTGSSHRKVHDCNNQDEIWPKTIDNVAAWTLASVRKAYQNINVVVGTVTNMVEHTYSGPTEAALAQHLKRKTPCDGGNFWMPSGLWQTSGK